MIAFQTEFPGISVKGCYLDQALWRHIQINALVDGYRDNLRLKKICEEDYGLRDFLTYF